jgi:hypothetical protein
VSDFLVLGVVVSVAVLADIDISVAVRVKPSNRLSTLIVSRNLIVYILTL